MHLCRKDEKKSKNHNLPTADMARQFDIIKKAILLLAI
jgi:hypothetical protein